MSTCRGGSPAPRSTPGAAPPGSARLPGQSLGGGEASPSPQPGPFGPPPAGSAQPPAGVALPLSRIPKPVPSFPPSLHPSLLPSLHPSPAALRAPAPCAPGAPCWARPPRCRGSPQNPPLPRVPRGCSSQFSAPGHEEVAAALQQPQSGQPLVISQGQTLNRDLSACGFKARNFGPCSYKVFSADPGTGSSHLGNVLEGIVRLFASLQPCPGSWPVSGFSLPQWQQFPGCFGDTALGPGHVPAHSPVAALPLH